jgi:hypothetical protein
MDNPLYFDLGEVLRVAEATLAATEHQDSFVDAADGKVTGPALMWVKDSGIYLMSNAVERPENDVIYARDGQPDGPLLDGTSRDDWERCRELVGGDDFAEYFHLDRATMAMLRVAKAHRGTSFIVDVLDGGERVALAVR